MRVLPALTQNQARALLGKTWNIGGDSLTFGLGGDRQRLHWRTGGEAIAYAMTDSRGKVAAYLRFLDAANPRLNTEQRIERTEWLVAQRLDTRMPYFLGAPQNWVSSYLNGRPTGVGFDFTATLLNAVPGKSWRDWKLLLDSGNEGPSAEIRLRAVRELIEALAYLEGLNLVHGDLSDGNILIDPNPAPGKPVLHLIDFDCFVCDVLPAHLQSLSIADGGMTGTPGYCPLDLEGAVALDAKPYSDLSARDQLLIELLVFRPGDAANQSPRNWARHSEVGKRLRNADLPKALDFLQDESIHQLDESKRLSSRDVAAGLGVSVRNTTPLSTARSAIPQASRSEATAPSQGKSKPKKPKQPKAAAQPQATPPNNWGRATTTPVVPQPTSPSSKSVAIQVLNGLLIPLYVITVLIASIPNFIGTAIFFGIPCFLILSGILCSLFFGGVPSGLIPNWVGNLAFGAAVVGSMLLAIGITASQSE